MFISCLIALIIAISEAGTNSIVCTALSSDSVRVVWMYDWTDFDKFLDEKEMYVYYVVSWFLIEDLKNEDRNFREAVDYQYNSKIIRYSYDSDYDEVLEDVASSFDLSSFYYIFVEEGNFAEIRLGVVPNRTLDIAVRRIFKSTNQRPDTIPRDKAPLRCSVMIPNYNGPATTLASSLSQASESDGLWIWIVIIPGILLTLSILIIGVYSILRLVQKIKSRSKVGLIASSWEAVSNNDRGRHWVMPRRSCTPSSREGTSLNYTRSSLISGASESWDQLHHRFPLTTVEEEPDATLEKAMLPQYRAAAGQQWRKYGQGRLSTPQVPDTTLDRLWLAQNKPIREVTSGSSSLWWSDEDTDQEAQKRGRRGWRSFSRERQYRRVAPITEGERRDLLDASVDEHSNLDGNKNLQFHSTRSEIPDYNPYRRALSSPKKRKLRSTRSSMNILSL